MGKIYHIHTSTSKHSPVLLTMTIILLTRAPTKVSGDMQPEPMQCRGNTTTAPSQDPIGRWGLTFSFLSVFDACLVGPQRSSQNKQDRGTKKRQIRSDLGAKRRNKRSRTALPPANTKILIEWFVKHWDSPFPNALDQRSLMQRTGMSQLQLHNWFVNRRKRNWDGKKNKAKSTFQFWNGKKNGRQGVRGMSQGIISSYSSMPDAFTRLPVELLSTAGL